MNEMNRTGKQNKSILLSAKGWLFSTVGVSSVLLILGFVNETARESFLGITIVPDVPYTKYILVGANFLWDLVALSAENLFLTVLFFAFLFFLFLSFRYVENFCKQHKKEAVFLFVVFSAIEISYFDAPFVRIDNLLFEAPYPNRSFGLPWIVEGFARNRWNAIICPRIPLESKQPQLRYCYESYDTQQQRLGEVEKLQRHFLVNMFITLFIFLYSSVFLIERFSIERARREKWLLALQTILIAMMIIDLLGLPYVHGKIVRSTDFHKTELFHEVVYDDDRVYELADELSSQVRDSDGQETPINHERIIERIPRKLVFVLAENKETILVYDYERLHLWAYPRGKVTGMRIKEAEDLLQYLILKKLQREEGGI